VAFKAPMCTLFNMSPSPPVGTPLSVRAPLEPIKGRAHMLEHKLSRKLSQKLSQVPQVHTHTRNLTLTQSQLFLTKTGNTSHSGRRVLCSGGLNQSKSLCASNVHTPLDQAFLDFPQTHTKLGLGGYTPPPGWRNLRQCSSCTYTEYIYACPYWNIFCGKYICS
jgi:hypothetical protein